MYIFLKLHCFYGLLLWFEIRFVPWVFFFSFRLCHNIFFNILALNLVRIALKYLAQLQGDPNNLAHGKGRLRWRVCPQYARGRKRDSKQTRVRLPQLSPLLGPSLTPRQRLAGDRGRGCREIGKGRRGEAGKDELARGYNIIVLVERQGPWTTTAMGTTP